jgi:hypothetical protein
MKVAKRRILIHVNLSPKTVKKFDMISQQFGMAPHTLASRLLRWFEQQDGEIREKILTARTARESRELAQILLHRIIKQAEKSEKSQQR